ncbi:MAG: hypothetical protein D6731_00505 [Planctomycetota bacterium]|nr:MAG: hypothetical protein D6731_00505 [Planctomycetota bacterium]
MLYALLRALVRHALAVFFRRIEVEGSERIPRSGPLLLAANHPNTLIDALLVASGVPRRVRFVAKATLFRPAPVGWLLRALGAVPVHRRQDGPVEQGTNARVLADCEEAVARGEALLIFPEGVSVDAPRLQKLKTGLARIALGAEERAPGRVVVVPAGLVYDDPATFRSRARVTYGEPIPVAPYRRLAESSGEPFVAVRALTEAVREALLAEVVHFDDDALGEDARLVDELYGGRVAREAGGRLAATAAIARAVSELSARDPARVERLRAALAAYRAALADAGVDDRAVRDRAPRAGVASGLALVAAAPLALWGALNHLVLYQLPRLVLKVLPVDRGYAATVKFLVGFLGFFLTYAVQGAAAHALAERAGGFASPWTPTLLYLGSLPPAGLVALLWGEAYASRRRSARVAARRRSLAPERLAALRAQRRELLRLLDEARAIVLDARLGPAAPAPPGEEPW